MRKLESLRVDEGIKIGRCLVYRADNQHVPKTTIPYSELELRSVDSYLHVKRRLEGRALEAMGPAAHELRVIPDESQVKDSRNGIQEFFHGNVGHNKGALLDDGVRWIRCHDRERKEKTAVIECETRGR